MRNMHKSLLLSFAMLHLVATTLAAARDDARATSLLGKYCVDCHNGDSPEGDLSLSGINAFADLDTRVWANMLEKIQLGEMPPEEAKQPSSADKQLAMEWIAAELRRNGVVVEDKSRLPNYGNLVDHEALFHQPDPHPAPATPVRLWRIRPEAYRKHLDGPQPLSMIPGHQISDFSALHVVDESAAEIVLRNASALVTRQIAFTQSDGKLVPANGADKNLVALMRAEEPDEAAIADAITSQFERALDRKPTDAELERTMALWRDVTDEVGPTHGLRVALTVPFLKPEAVYRLELGSGSLDEHGRRRLSPREIAQAISYALSNNRSLLSENTPLATRDEVAAAVQRLLERPLDQTPRMLGFFDEYFDYQKAKGVFKEGQSWASQLVRDTEVLIRHIVEEDKDVLKRLLTTDSVHVSRAYPFASNNIAQAYGLAPDFKRVGEMVRMPGLRAGMLTQPSWLIAHSGNFDNDPVRRGKWIRERLLGGTIPDVPISVDAVVPDHPEKTLRERFAVTRDAYCWKCHQKMDLLGLPFEAFDHYGKLRRSELGEPVDTTGAITDSGDPKLNGTVEDPYEMIHRLARSDRVQEVFVRYAFRYYLGRNETLRDAKTLREANAAYEKSGGSYRALIVSLLSSDSFLYRINPEVDALVSKPNHKE